MRNGSLSGVHERAKRDLEYLVKDAIFKPAHWRRFGRMQAISGANIPLSLGWVSKETTSAWSSSLDNTLDEDTVFSHGR